MHAHMRPCTSKQIWERSLAAEGEVSSSRPEAEEEVGPEECPHKLQALTEEANLLEGNASDRQHHSSLLLQWTHKSDET